jgi:tetratricopeptide (TPR) repeat protein
MRDEALAAVQDRIESFVNGGDPDSVLDRGALVQAEALMADAGTPPAGSQYPADVEAMSAVARLHLCRAEALGTAGAHDKQLALGLFAGLWAIDADLVPVGIRQALQNSGELDRNPAVLSAQGLKQRYRFQRTGDLADLDRALELSREALAVAPATHTGRNRLLANIAEMLAQRCKVTGLLDELEEAITYSRAAVDATPLADPLREDLQRSLIEHLSAHAQITGSVRELDEAIAVARVAVETDVSDHAQRLGSLCGLLITRTQLTGDLRTIEEAVAVGRQCVEAADHDDPRLCAYFASLCAALLRRFLRIGRLADLDGAIVAGRDALSVAHPNSADLALANSNLGNALMVRHERTGQVSDINEAINLLREAVAHTELGELVRPVRLANLGNTLQARFERLGNRVDIDEAISLKKQVVRAMPPGPTRAAHLSNLSGSLQRRYEADRHPADLHQAVRTAREAAATAAGDDPHVVLYQSNLSNALRMRYELLEDPKALDEAITAARAATTPATDQVRAQALINYGLALWARQARTEAQPDREEAIASWRAAAAIGAAEPHIRLMAVRAWANAAHEIGDFVTAADGYAAGVELLPQLAWHGVDRGTREDQLADWNWLATDAAACCVQAGQPERAVELLEQGRSVLWGQTLHLRGDLSALRAVRPEIARRLDEIRRLLDRPETQPPVGTSAAMALEVTEAKSRDERTQLAREWDDLLAQVRAIDGFSHFLAPVPFGELCRGTAGGPVVIVNVSRHGCHALVVTEAGVGVIPLPDLTRADAIERTNNFLIAVYGAVQADASLFDRLRLSVTMTATLEWLWDSVADPVLAKLGHDRTPESADGWPRVWWCPTGPLTVLPLHAAGRGALETSAAVIDRVVSSYTPTLTAARRIRDYNPTLRAPRLLVVAAPNTASADVAELPGVGDELRAVDRYVTGVLSGPKAIRANVLRALPAHEWVHFACHGSQDFNEPTKAALRLWDGPLTILDLAGQSLTHAELAYLSACDTAVGGVRLLDEAIHLSAALGLVGYRHVIATLWSVVDEEAAEIAASVYADLAAGGVLSASDAARALHRAVRRLRAEYPDEPALWAPYIHSGP